MLTLASVLVQLLSSVTLLGAKIALTVICKDEWLRAQSIADTVAILIWITNEVRVFTRGVEKANIVQLRLWDVLLTLEIIGDIGTIQALDWTPLLILDEGAILALEWTLGLTIHSRSISALILGLTAAISGVSNISMWARGTRANKCG